MVLVGNKCDLWDERQVTTEEGRAMAQQMNIPFLETSACSGVHVQDVFLTLTESIILSTKRPQNSNGTPQVRRKDENCSIQ